eukprot:Rmarinus@m.17561
MRVSSLQYDEPETLEDFFSRHAITIQTWWRKRLKRLQHLRDREARSTLRIAAAKCIQRVWRRYWIILARRKRLDDVPNFQAQYWDFEESKLEVYHQCATRIQIVWRNYLNRRIFKYYANLIKFREMGDPALMLRSINPREASLLDSAAGIHLRFRLGGHEFPPVIYYKIYTHSPLVDLGSFAPRDYANYKPPNPRQRHNKVDYRQESMETWYKRIENNGWRPMSKRLFCESDPVTVSSSKKPVFVHHIRAVRREELIRRRKKKKVEWLRKIYRAGMMSDRAKTAGGSAEDDDDDGASDIDWDMEADELLQWSENLDFEAYHSNWATLATSGRSDFMQGVVPRLDEDSLEAYFQAYADGGGGGVGGDDGGGGTGAVGDYMELGTDYTDVYADMPIP